MDERLEDLEAQTLYVVGLATDSCVKQTVLDACRLGFRVVVLRDGVRGIDREPGDSERALEAMREAGAIVAHSADCAVRT